ncbi:MAG: VWA domain-containing protein [Chloroflexi bacterium]|nr:VWA domain-containing protein [Chloroflexota bacterium]
MAIRYRYSEWDGSQELPSLDADGVLEALSDDLLNFGDLQHALRNMLQRGIRGGPDDRVRGLRDLLQRLRGQRRERLDRFDLGGVMETVRRELGELLALERETIERRLAEAGAEAGPDAPDPAERADGKRDGDGAREPAPGAEGEPPGDGQARGDDEADLARMLRRVVERKQRFLDELPPDAPGQIGALRDYEFLSPEAQHRFQDLLRQLREGMAESLFRDVSKMVDEMSEGDTERMKQMVRDLNDMLTQRMRGEEPDFDSFLERYGDMFGENPPRSLDELIEQLQEQARALQSLMESLPPGHRQQLEGLLSEKLGDRELQAELFELAQNLEFLSPSGERGASSYPFRGDEELDLRAALALMEEMHEIDALERGLEKAQYGGDLDQVDRDALRELLGDDAAEDLDRLQELLDMLERAGYLRRDGDEWELTPRGTRLIGQKALAEIYQQLRRYGLGDHALPTAGRHGERTDDTKPYEFGDPFHLHIERTVMNALERSGPSTPVRLAADDFAIYRSEQLTQTATVMMVDLSWSMALRGSFQAAKKVALALHNLIGSQYPRDSLYLIGFSAYARELRPEELPYVRWDESVLGTNMHHALMLAERLLSRHRGGTRQILMITDGEPTAHLERGRSRFAYPPSPATIRETLKAVMRVSRRDITINTFMLDRSYYLKDFVNQLAKINGGRVFYTTPDRLGEYILVDYLQGKRQRLSSRSS